MTEIVEEQSTEPNSAKQAESLFQSKVKVSTVLALLGPIVAAVIFALYELVLTPYAELIRESESFKHRYENLDRDHENALSIINELKDRIAALDRELSVQRANLEVERIKSEERIKLKQIEADKDKLVLVAEAESKARISEAEATKTVSERESQARQIESFNGLRSRLVLACVESKKAATPDADKPMEEVYLDDCNYQYEGTMSQIEFQLLNPDVKQVDSYDQMRARIIFTCMEDKDTLANIGQLDEPPKRLGIAPNNPEEGVQAVETMSKYLRECSSNFDMQVSEYEGELREFFQASGLQFQ